MAKVILSLDGVVVRELTLTKERTTIGRRAHNDIHIDNLAVSGDHAVIVSVVEDYFLEDLGSTNGTLVNGKPIKRHLLKSNDVIELGKFKLEFIGRSAASPHQAADYEKTMVFRPKAPSEPPGAAPSGAAGEAAATRPGVGPAASPATRPGVAASASPPPPRPSASSAAASARAAAAPADAARASGAAPLRAAATAASAPASPLPSAAGAAAVDGSAPPVSPRAAGEAWGAIRVVSGPGAGRERALTQPVTTLGKPGVQVAMLTRRAHGYYLAHVEGAVHPQVNGQTIGAEPFPLKDRDIIELTGLKVEFLARRGQAAPSTRKLWTVGLAIVIVIVGYVLWKMRR